VRRSVLFAGATIGLAIGMLGVAAYADDSSDGGSEWERVVDEAREQMASQTFDGVVAVQWHDVDGTHGAHMRVRQHDGMVQIMSTGRTVAGDSERVLLDGQAWTTMSSAHNRAPGLTAGKYRIVRSAGPTVAGHATTRYDAVRDGHTVERLYVQDETSLVLRREVLDAAGHVARAVSFVRVDPKRRVTAPPVTAADAGPTPVADLDGPYHDPSRVGDGFRLVGRWTHRDDLAQLYYTDGVLSVSVFEQPGRLAWSALPGGGVEAEIGGNRARRYELPAGGAWVFERDGVVYTFVGDATASELDAIARDISRPEQSRVERLAETVVDPFRW
jgi:hypothetical protein